ncbi:MAG: ECF-type sigma factor [Planctomycetota bacterium]
MTRESDPSQVTAYLHRMQVGDPAAMNALLPLVYDDLRRLAESALRTQWRNHTLQPTALVHEAYLRLVDPDSRGFESRSHFLAVASLAMRQLLQDYARARRAAKRDGSLARLEVESLELAEEHRALDLVALDDALEALAALDPRQARIVEMRFLLGMSVAETARAIGVSERTVYNDWGMARAWLERRLASQESD